MELQHGNFTAVFYAISMVKKHGYKKADRVGMMELVWKPLLKIVNRPFHEN